MKKGFTLSEVLITLSIVGIVAALTVPGVMKNYQNRMYTAQLKKAYSQVANATLAIMNDENTDNFFETSAANETKSDENDDKLQNPKEGMGYFLTKYFTTARRNCSEDGTCASKAKGFYTNVNGIALDGVDKTNYCVLTVSGATICGKYNPSNNCASVLVDVNGVGRPNVAGRDIFAMDIHKDGTLSDYWSACLDGHAGEPADKCLTYTGDVYRGTSGCLNNVIGAGWSMEY